MKGKTMYIIFGLYKINRIKRIFYIINISIKRIKFERENVACARLNAKFYVPPGQRHVGMER